MTNFNCENNFDLIIVPGGSFQLLDDRNDALAALKNFQKLLFPAKSQIKFEKVGKEL